MPTIANYRGKRPKLVWNGHTILFRYPLDAAVVFSEPRKSSVVRRVASGEEAAWVPGHDSYLSGEVQYIPSTGTGGVDTGWDDTFGWRAFLAYAWEGGSFTYWPDATDAGSSFDALLVAPMEGEEPEPEADFTRRLALTIAHADGAAITGYEPAYRLRVYAPRSVNDATESELLYAAGGLHLDAFRVASIQDVAGYRPYLDTPRGTRGKLDLLARSTEIGQRSYLILDKAFGPDVRWFTAFSGDGDGVPQLYGCRVEEDESLDGGATWDLIFTGRIEDCELEDATTGRIEAVSLAAELQDAEVFVGGIPHEDIDYAWPQTLLPVGLPIAWGGLAAVPAVRGTVGTLADSRKFIFSPGSRDRRNTITEAVHALADAVSAVIIPGSGVGFTLEFNGAQADVVIGTPGSGSEVLYPLRAILLYPPSDTTEQHYRCAGVIADGFSAFTNGQSKDFRIVPRAKPSEAFPLLIGRVHPWQLVRDLLDGKFGYLDEDTGDPTRTFPYDAATFDDFIADGSWGTVRHLVTGREQLLEFIEEKICRENGGGWRPNAAGEFVPLDLRLSAATSTATITDVDLVAEAGAVKPRGSSKGAINRVNATYYSDAALPIEYEKGKGEWPSIPNTMLDSREVPLIVVDNSGRAQDLGDKPEDLDLTGHRFTQGGSQISQLLSRVALQARVVGVADELKAPFAGGDQTYSLRLTRAGAGTLAMGDFVTVTVSELPDPATNVRGGARLALCLEADPDGPAIYATFQDIGAGTVLDAPTLSDLAVDVDDPTAVTLTVTLDAGSDPVRLEVAQTTDTVVVVPAATDAAWTPWGSADATGTVTLSGLTPGARVWVRGRSVSATGAAGPSAWAYTATPEYVDLAGLTAPSGLTIVSVNTDQITFAWTNGESEVPVEVLAHLGTSALDEDVPSVDAILVLPAGSTRYTLRTLASGATLTENTAYRVGVRHADGAGGVSAVATTTQTTTATGSATPAPTMAGIAVKGGTGTEVDTGQRTGILITLFPGDPAYAMELERAPDLAGSPDTGSAETIATAIPPATTTYADALPLDGETRHYRARHIPGGAWTAWKSAIPGILASGEAPQPAVLPQLALIPTQTTTVGTLTVEVTDPQGRVSEVAFKTKSGNAGVESSYAVDASVPYATTVALVDGQASTITVRVTYADADGVSVQVVRAQTFNAGGVEDGSITPAKLSTSAKTFALAFEFGDALTVPTVSTRTGYVRVPVGATITRADIVADASGSAVVDLQKAATPAAGAAPSFASITASAKPTLSSTASDDNASLTGWTTAVAAGDLLMANLDSVTTCTKIVVTLTCVRS